MGEDYLPLETVLVFLPMNEVKDSIDIKAAWSFLIDSIPALVPGSNVNVAPFRKGKDLSISVLHLTNTNVDPNSQGCW